MLARHFVTQSNQRHGRNIAAINPTAIAALQGWKWPGNVRELENAIERAVVLCRKDTITIEDLPPTLVEHRQLVQPRRVPHPRGDDEQWPCNSRVYKRVQDASNRSTCQQWPGPGAAHAPRQSSKQGWARPAQQEQWWGHQHEQNVLQHVGLQQQAANGVKWRCQCDPDGEQSTAECDGARGAVSLGHALVQGGPPTQIDNSRQRNRGRHEWFDRPRAQDCFTKTLHGLRRLAGATGPSRFVYLEPSSQGGDHCSGNRSGKKGGTSCSVARGVME